MSETTVAPVKVEMFGLTTMVEVAELKVKAQAMADVLENHEVFGRHGTDHAFYEKVDFVRAVVSHMSDTGRRNGLELTYRESNVRINIHTKIVAGEAKFREVSAYAHPRENPSIDFEQMNEDIQERFAE